MKISQRIAIICMIIASPFLNGCAVIQAETNNRGGYLDQIADDHWMRADSKAMRAVRAYSIQASLARIASISPRPASDRAMMALRVGHATSKFDLVYQCAFEDNPTGIAEAKTDPCFFFDSLMVDYTTSLFDLAMVSFPFEDTKHLLNLVGGGLLGGVGAIDAINALVSLAGDALKYGRVIGALYRDTIELQVQLWIDTNRRYNFDEAYSVASLENEYRSGRDNLAVWKTYLNDLSARGLEPKPTTKHIAELSVAIQYMCSLIVQAKDTSYKACVEGLPKLNTPAAQAVAAKLSRSVVKEQNYQGQAATAFLNLARTQPKLPLASR